MIAGGRGWPRVIEKDREGQRRTEKDREGQREAERQNSGVRLAAGHRAYRRREALLPKRVRQQASGCAINENPKVPSSSPATCVL